MELIYVMNADLRMLHFYWNTLYADLLELEKEKAEFLWL